MQGSVAKLKISTIDDHNADEGTDKLYDPLRNVIMNPESVTQHEISSPKAAEKTLIHDRYERMTAAEAARIKKEIFIPVDQQLVATDHLDRIQGARFKVVDAQERVIGGLMKRQEINEIIRKKKDSRIVYEFGGQVEKKPTSNDVSDLLRYNRSNPNLRSQILSGESTVTATKTSYNYESSALNKVSSETRLPTYEQIEKWLTFKERESLRKMKESQINKEAKGYVYEYEVTGTGTRVNAKLNRQNSTGSIRGSTIMEPVPIPGSPRKVGSEVKVAEKQFIAQPLQREYHGSVPLPMAYQPVNTTSSRQNFTTFQSERIVDERFVTPVKTVQKVELKQLPTTAVKETSDHEEYAYKVKPMNEQVKEGGCGFCN